MQKEQASWQEGLWQAGLVGEGQSRVEVLRDRLTSLPPSDAAALGRKMSAFQVVAQLRAEIEGALARGWTIETLAAEIAAGGVKLTSNTLRAYLSRSRTPAGRQRSTVSRTGADLATNVGRPKRSPK